jgi:hypothetical protein
LLENKNLVLFSKKNCFLILDRQRETQVISQAPAIKYLAQRTNLSQIGEFRLLPA